MGFSVWDFSEPAGRLPASQLARRTDGLPRAGGGARPSRGGDERHHVGGGEGRADELHVAVQPEPLRVVVVGGGPGGLATAIGFGNAGHRATVIEKRAAVGAGDWTGRGATPWT